MAHRFFLGSSVLLLMNAHGYGTNSLTLANYFVFCDYLLLLTISNGHSQMKLSMTFSFVLFFPLMPKVFYLVVDAIVGLLIPSWEP